MMKTGGFTVGIREGSKSQQKVPQTLAIAGLAALLNRHNVVSSGTKCKRTGQLGLDASRLRLH